MTLENVRDITAIVLFGSIALSILVQMVGSGLDRLFGVRR